MRNLILAITTLGAVLLVIDEVFVGFPPPGWIYPLVPLLFAVGLLRRRPLDQQRKALIGLAAITCSLVVIHLVAWPSRDPFFADLFSITPGMSPTEVRKVMARHIEGTGAPAIPPDPSRPGGEFTIRGAIVFRCADAGPGDSDWGIVHFEKGRVSSIEFSPD